MHTSTMYIETSEYICGIHNHIVHVHLEGIYTVDLGWNINATVFLYMQQLFVVCLCVCVLPPKFVSYFKSGTIFYVYVTKTYSYAL